MYPNKKKGNDRERESEKTGAIEMRNIIYTYIYIKRVGDPCILPLFHMHRVE
jgi:hypothetical protein